jgi:ATP-dependent DNA helicase DinG
MQLVDAVEHAAQSFFRSWSASRASDLEGRRLLGAPDWTPLRRDAADRLDAAIHALSAFSESHVMDEGLALLARRAGDLRADLARIAATASKRDAHWVPDEEEAAVRSFDGGVIWIEARERSVQLGASPVDLAPMLRERLFDRVPAIVCTSATLATATSAGPSFHFAKSRLGARTETDELVVSSPFDFASRAALYVAEDMPEPSMLGFEDACAARALELATLTGGGAFVLCTSNRAMRSIHASLVGRSGGPLMVQGEAPKHVLLDRFRASTEAILVATMSFWEGVDVPGNALRLVVIDKIPFAVPTDPVVAARCSKIESEGGNPFTQYSVPSAAIALKQGFGRLIRTKRDAGIVAILDRRAVKKGYGKLLLSSLPPARRVYSVDEVRDFWQSMD